MGNKEKILYKVVSFINREELDFLDRIIKDNYFSTGEKVPRAQLIREIIHISKSLPQIGKEIIEELRQAKQEKGKKIKQD